MLIEMLIAASCASGQYNQACSKAMEAGTKQTGIYQNVDKAESMGKQEALKTVTNVAGETPAAVVGVAAKSYHDKGVTYSFKPVDVLSIDRITTRVGKGTGTLNFEWRF